MEKPTEHITESIGMLTTTQQTQRERNLKVKTDMIKKGLRKAPLSSARTQRDLNLELKNKNNPKSKEDEKTKTGKEGQTRKEQGRWTV